MMEKYIHGKENKVARNVIIGVLVYSSLLAIGYMSKVRGNAQTFGKNITPLLLAAITWWLLLNYSKIKEKRKKITALIGGSLLALSHVFGMYLHYKNTLFDTAGQILLLLAVVLGYMILTVPLFAMLLTEIEKMVSWWQMRQCQPNFLGNTRLLFVKYWVFIFVCYVPVFLHNWPVNFIFDAKYQLQEVINNAYKIHHPLLHTILMGECYKLGDILGSVSLGMSFYTIFQMLVLTAAFAYAMVYLYNKGIPKVARIIILLFYALFPMNSIFSITATKDVLFAAFFLFFFVLLVKLCYDQEKLTLQKGIGLLVSGVLMILFRRNALYALFLALPFLIWARKGKCQRGVITLIFLCCILVSNVVNDSIIRVVNATNNDSLQESMSVPFQQIARVACYRQADMDAALYDEVLNYWSEEKIKKYNPYLSDDIKGSVNAALVEQNMINFWKMWAKIGLKFPGEYLESFLTNTLGYWYLGDTAHMMAVGDDVSLYHTLIGAGEEIVKKDYFPWFDGLYDSLFHKQEYRDVPVLGFSFRCSLYCWLLLVFVIYTIYQKEYKKFLIMMLLFGYVASCFLGPWVILRYIFSIVICCPIVIMLWMDKQ